MIYYQIWLPQAILVSDWSISKKSLAKAHKLPLARFAKKNIKM
jgi:hypothetical protein